MLAYVDMSGGITLTRVWGQVSGYYTTGLTGEQQWTFTLRSGTGGLSFAKGSMGVAFGASGQGYVLMDAVTAVSGSGPAYVFYPVEAMAAAGIKAGLPAELAMQLARATVAGSGELLHRSELAAEQLRKNVTSPNGTTYAALQVLMAPDGIQPVMDQAIAAASRRSKELAG